MAKIAVTWKKSSIGFPQDQRRTIVGLGLKRLHHTVEHDDSPAILGMVNKVKHLVDVSEVAEPVKRPRRSTTKAKATKTSKEKK